MGREKRSIFQNRKQNPVIVKTSISKKKIAGLFDRGACPMATPSKGSPRILSFEQKEPIPLFFLKEISQRHRKGQPRISVGTYGALPPGTPPKLYLPSHRMSHGHFFGAPLLRGRLRFLWEGVQTLRVVGGSPPLPCPRIFLL